MQNRIGNIIKMLAVTGALWIIYYKIDSSSSNIGISAFISFPNNFFLSIAFVLLFVNWGIEAYKWKFMISKFESITFYTSLKSILAGVTVSILTPNRTGEFAARVFFLSKTDKITASVISIFGSSFQLLVTLLMGCIAYGIYTISGKHYLDHISLMSAKGIYGILIIVGLVLLLTIIILKKKSTWTIKIKNLGRTLKIYSAYELIKIFLLSFIRYMVFCLQFWLILAAFGLQTTIVDEFVLIMLVFFVSTIIPTFALTEIAVRSATSVLLLGSLLTNSDAIIAASLLLWIFNLAIPAILGSFFIPKMKLLRNSTTE